MVATEPAPGDRRRWDAVSVLVAAGFILVAVLAYPRHRADAWVLRSGSTSGELTEPSSSIDEGGPWTRGHARLRAVLGRERRARHELEVTLGVLDALAPALRAGLTPVAALGCLDLSAARSSRVSVLLARLVEAAERGEPLAPVWARQARDVGSVELALVGRAWALSESLGAPLADCVGMAADLVRQRMARERQLAVALAGPRATTAVLTLLPLAGPGVAFLLGIGPGELYSGVPALGSVVLGLLLLAVGRWWCARMVHGLARARPAGDGS